MVVRRPGVVGGYDPGSVRVGLLGPLLVMGDDGVEVRLGPAKERAYWRYWRAGPVDGEHLGAARGFVG